jgi:DNA modification methylase
MRRPMLHNSRAGDVVYDPFLGSGTTLIAAQNTGRLCYALDIDARYVDVAIVRWQKLTGLEARLDGDGLTFTQTAGARSAQPEVIDAAA